MDGRTFSSKILLFGEYSIIKSSWGLAINYDLFDGKLHFPGAGDPKRPGIDSELSAFAEYLQRTDLSLYNGCQFDYSSFKFDVGQGLYFDSTIPQGYGVGSSGALCAAVFDRYCINKSEVEQDIALLKRVLAQMESHFHGSSSGLDPLISYLNHPLLIQEHDIPTKVNLTSHHLESEQRVLFLLDTGRPRRTEPLVQLFLEKCKDPKFSYRCEVDLTGITNECISSFIEHNFDELYKNFRLLSSFQLENFTPMIPNLYLDIWQEGIKSDDYYLKLCGAGGGGFLMGIAKNRKILEERLASQRYKTL
jgi:mevalonate kinase